MTLATAAQANDEHDGSVVTVDPIDVNGPSGPWKDAGKPRSPRTELLDFLAQGERNVEELAKAAGLSVANTSKHLQQLKSAGLVEAHRDGKHVRYRLADDRALDAIRDLRVLAEAHLDQVGDLVASYLSSP